jgi:hypothetical protein
VKNWQVIEKDREGVCTLENRVDVGVGRVRAIASCQPDSDTRTTVEIEKVLFEGLGQEFSLNVNRDSEGYVDWLYVDDRIRVTKGNRGSWFVHEREE